MFSPSSMLRAARTVVTFLALSLPAGRAQVHINEFVAENPGRPIDANAELDMDGNSPDWIELRSTLGVSTNLAGWALSDDPAVPGKWIFPSQTIAANGYLKVYASGKNRAIAGVQLHTNFKLGEQDVLLLSRPLGGGSWQTVSQFGSTVAPYPRQRPGLSYGYPSNNRLATPGYFLSDTPGASNGSTVATNFVGDTTFSVDRGFYDAPFTVVISNKTAGATLVYTLNGSEPSATNGIQVPPASSTNQPSVSLTISDSTILRARGIRTGWIPSDIDTQTYIFWNRVRTQTGPLPTTGISGTDPAVTVQWGTTGGDIRTPAGPDWEVDPMVVNTNNVASKFVYDDLKSIPSVSLVTTWKGLFGPSTAGTSAKDGGIYVGGETATAAADKVANEGVDRVFSFEYFNPAGSTNLPNAVKGFHVDGKAHVFGGTSQTRWKSYKLSLNFKAVQDVTYDVYGDGATDTHRTFILDSRMNQTWMHPTDVNQRTRGDYVRDQVMADLQLNMGTPGWRNRAVHLFLNGMYWGVYSLHERPDEKFMADYLGGEADDWDVYKHSLAPNFTESDPLVNGTYSNPSAAISRTNCSTLDNFNALMALFGVTFTGTNSVYDLRLQSRYDPIWQKLDRQPFLDYLLLNFFAGNSDWSHKNLYAAYHRADPAAKWRFFNWDAEHVFRDSTENFLSFSPTAPAATTGRRGSPHHFHYLLGTNTEYRIAFADTIQRHMFNGGALTVANLQGAFNRRLDEIDRAIRGESARWGDCRRDAQPYSRGAEWLAEKNRILNTVIPERHANMLANFRTAGMYPAATAPAPVFSVFGGLVTNGYPLVITAPGGTGTIYYTRNGADPRQAWTGTATGTAYTAPVVLTQPGRVKARFRSSGGVWSALTEADFVPGVAASSNNLIITEIYYNPPGSGAAEDVEFIELLNTSAQTVDLTQVEFTNGVTFAFADATFLTAGQRVVLVKDRTAFTNHFGAGLASVVAGEFAGSLDNAGETLTLIGRDGPDAGTEKDLIWTLTYGDANGWPVEADGDGYSLTWVNGAWPQTDPEHWRGSASAAGSPGSADSTAFTGNPGDDLNANQRPDLLDYAVPDGRLHLSAWSTNNAWLAFQRALTADGAVTAVECSTNLVTWTELPAVPHRLSKTRLPGNLVEEVWTHSAPSPGEPTWYYRLRVQPR